MISHRPYFLPLLLLLLLGCNDQPGVSDANTASNERGQVSPLSPASPPSTQKGALSPTGKKPNIIFILADDLGYGHLGSYGQATLKTPALDRMADEGIRFTQAYAGSTVCAPSRSVLMTGQHTGHTTVRANWDLEGNRIPLLDEDVTIAEVLKDAGYTTGMIGKWGLGEPGTTGLPNRQGFDYWFGFLNQHNAHSYFPPYLWRNDRIVYFNENENGQRNTYIHDVMVDETLSFIEGNKDTPFFLYLPYTLPHTELAAPEELVAPFRGQFDMAPLPPMHGRPGVSDPAAVYAGMISALDRDVGRILDKLSSLGIAENTLVIFTSDNGPATEEGAAADFFDGNGALRGIKRDLYEGGIRVPLIAWWPNTVPANQVDGATVWALWDFLPSLAELAGGETPEDVDGISQIQSLFGEPATEPARRLYWEFRKNSTTPLMQAARIGNWKAVRNSPQGQLELYDLSSDPGESIDRSSDFPDLVKQFVEFINQSSESVH